MPQRNFGRSVARAAASGGGKAYRGRPAVGFYLLMIFIVVVGTSLIVYSRQERLHPNTAAATGEGPTLTSSWHAALSIDLCGTAEPNLPASTNLASTGLRTLGDGLIYIEPGVVTTGKPASFEGKNANLSVFAANYSGFKLTDQTIKIPTSKLYTNGDICGTLPKSATAAQKTAAEGQVRIETWASPTAKGKVLAAAIPTAVHLTNGEMISIGFVTPSMTLPVPASKSALISVLNPSAATTTTTTASATTATTTPSVTTTSTVTITTAASSKTSSTTTTTASSKSSSTTTTTK